MRLLVVAESFLPRVDGVTRTVVSLTRHLRRSGHDAVIVAPGRGPHECEGFPVVRVMGLTGLFYPDLTIAPFVPGLRRLLRDAAPDLVHLASPAALGACVVRAARRAGVPVVAHYQTDLVAYARHYGGRLLSPGVQAWERRLHNRCARTYAPTAAMAEELRRRGIERVGISGRGVDAELFRPGRPGAATATARWSPGDGPRLLCVSRLAAEKGLHRLVTLARAHPELRLLVVGAGPERAALEHLAPPSMRFAGLLQGDALADVYGAADLFVFPSATETFGQVVQEAMASGLPVVGMRAGGTAALIRDGVTGVLADPDDEDAFIDAAARLAHDAGRRHDLAAAARLTVAERSWDGVFDALLDDYEAVVARRRRALPLPPATAPGGGRSGLRSAAFFDVDRTVLRGSCFLALAGPLCRNGLLRRRTLLRAALHQLWFSARGASPRSLESAAQRGAAVVRGMEAQRLHDAGIRHLQRHVLSRVYPAAREALRRHRRRGDLVFLVSSAPHEIVAPLAAALGADGHAATHAAIAGGRYTGEVTLFCHGEEKARQIRLLAQRHGLDLARCTAYADSVTDLPMLAAVGRAVCINPDTSLRAQAQRHGWEVRQWRLPSQAMGAPDRMPLLRGEVVTELHP